MNDTVLRVLDLCTEVQVPEGHIALVDGISFEIGAGETLALVGESGCGKTMTALSLMGLLPPGARVVGGSIRLCGEELVGASPGELRRKRGRQLSMVFQEPQSALNPVMRVGEQIAEVLRTHRNLNGAALHARVVQMLSQVGIADPERRSLDYPHQLSGGMKQRAVIAMAIATEPRLLIADEPTTALDVTVQAQILALLRQLQAQSGMAILLITHDLGVVAELGEKVGVMYAGQLVERASTRRFFARASHPYARKLFESIPARARRDQRLAVVGGAVPAPGKMPTGCRFAPRCGQAWERCSREMPGEWFRERDHGVRCHLFEGRDEIQSAPATEPPYSPATSNVRVVHPQFPVPETRTFDDDRKGTGGALLSVHDLQVRFRVRSGWRPRQSGQGSQGKWLRAVDGVSIDVAPGRTLALVGESGCGKTSLGKALVQLIDAAGGRIEFDGTELRALKRREMRRRRADLQIIFQDAYASMNPRMRVGDIVAEGMINLRPGDRAGLGRRRVGELLQRVGLDATSARRYPHEFSGGQRQRICIARALAVDPKLVVCDEPTSALDVSVQAQILNLLRQFQRERGLAYVFITHDWSVVEYLADEIAVMYLGRIVERGPATELLDNPAHPYTQALLSAIPSLDPRGGRKVIRIDGEAPSALGPPSGCHFHPRCRHASARCRGAYPADQEIATEHHVSCHLFAS